MFICNSVPQLQTKGNSFFVNSFFKIHKDSECYLKKKLQRILSIVTVMETVHCLLQTAFLIFAE